MEPLELAAIVATIVAGIVAVYALLAGSQPLPDVLKKLWAKLRQKGRPPSREERGGELRLRDRRFGSLDSQTPYEVRAGVPNVDQVVNRIKELVSSSKYDQAVSIGKETLDALAELGKQDKLEYQLAVGELAVWYAHALIYVGQPKNAISLLQEIIASLERQRQHRTVPSFGSWRWNLVLGRAHNHIGYASWMELGQYEVALKEFSASIPYFLAGECKEELATVYDNLGRVYGQLGYRTRAELLIDHGRQIRLDMHDDYRYALSLNSRAIVHLAFGQPYRALVLSEEARRIFEQQKERKGERGFGLALITKGQALRYLGTYWKYSARSAVEEYRGYLNDAIVTLRSAIRIFEDKVAEPVRLFQTYNELGCAYRELMDLGKKGDPESAREAERYLRKSIKLVEDKNPVLYVDACEDLAQTYFKGGDRRNATRWLRRAEEAIEAISSSYKLHKNVGIQAIPPTECIEDFWQQLGKVYMLRGHMTFDEGALSMPLDRRALREALEYYTLAAGYFGRFLERPLNPTPTPEDKQLYPRSRPRLANHRLFIGQVYDRLRLLKVEDLQYIQEVLRTLEEIYSLKPSWLAEFYEDTLGLLLQVRPFHNSE